MSRSAIKALILWTVGALAAGTALLVTAAALAVNGNMLLVEGGDVVGFRGGSAAVVVTIALIAVVALIAAAVLSLVAWIGALVETAALPEKGWFVVILVVGLLGLVLVADLAYLIGSPGSRPPSALATTPAPATAVAPEV